MRIEIEVSQETLATVMDGRCVEGRLRLQLSSMGTHHVIGFGPYNRKPRVRVPKELGSARVISILDRDHQGAKEALMDRELDLIEFC